MASLRVAEAMTPILAEETIDGYRAVLRSYRTRLPDGRTGWYQRSNGPDGGCLRAAVATATQIPYDDVPALFTDGDLWAFADERGYEARPLEQWQCEQHPQYLGFTATRHVVVCAFGRIYFDPASGWVFPDLGNGRCPLPQTLTRAWALERKEQ